MADKIKKLSQAIRLGATFRPQCFGTTFKEGASCALGAAYEVFTGIGDMDTFNLDSSPNHFDAIGKRVGFSEEAWEKIRRKITHRNDTHKQSREAIADWLESQGY